MKTDPQAVSPYIEKQIANSSHQLLAKWLSELEPGVRVLDVGAATGILGHLCANKGFVFVGIEPQPDWAAQARPYYASFLPIPVEVVLQNHRQELVDFDVVVFADVLEHLVDPQAVLRLLVDLQPEDCLFFISLPNIANLWVRLNLLFGRFDYMDRGILDRTHLHFYTYRTMMTFLAIARLQSLRVEATSIPLELIHPFFTKTRLGRLAGKVLHILTKVFPRLLGYQFVVMAEKRQVVSQTPAVTSAA